MTRTPRLSWRDVRDRIHDAILEGRYGPGDRLPRDADIAATLDCARSTVQRAMRDLADSGLVERRRKGGSRVRPDPVTRATLDIPVIRAEIERRGSRYAYQLLSCTEAVPPAGILAACELTGPETMLRVKALHLADGRPYMLEDRWISLQTVPEIRAVDLSRQSANEWLVLNRPYSRCDMAFYAQTADPGMADALGTEPGAALFAIERTTWIDTAPITTVRAFAAPGYRLAARS